MLPLKNKSKILMVLAGCLVFLFTFIYVKGSISYPVYEDGSLYIVEWVFREDARGQIIGNPDFKPSFDKVDAKTFMEAFKDVSASFGYMFDMTEPELEAAGTFEFSTTIDDQILLRYGEGFIILSFDAYRGNETLFYEVLRTLYFTLSPDEDLDSFPKFSDIRAFDEYKNYFYPVRVDYRFYAEDDYQVHIEDMKMGH